MLAEIALIALGVGALASGAYHAVALARIIRSLRAAPPLERWLEDQGCAVESDWPRVCVIVPAHNEEKRVGALARSLATQEYPNLRVVFVLDRCDDDTEGRIRDEIGEEDDRFEILHNRSCPEDWAGKTHAAWRGVCDSAAPRDADYLLFTDADTIFHPRCVRAAVRVLRERGVEMLSLLSLLRRGRWFERIVQPMAVLELLRKHPLHRVNNPKNRRSFANGQFMLFDRRVYEAIGGHERVCDALCEDIAFGRAMKRDGRSWLVLRAGQALQCGMYESWNDFRRGWKRIFIESSQGQPAELRRRARRLAMLPAALPLIGLASLIAGAALAPGAAAFFALALGAAAVLLWLAAFGLVMRSQGERLALALTSPLGAWMTAAILREASRDLTQGRGVAWGGRRYQRLAPAGAGGDSPSKRAEAIG